MVERRDFLKRTMAAGTGAFAVPMIITVDAAEAQSLTSPPPEPPGRSGAPGVDLPGSTPGSTRSRQMTSATTGRRTSGRTQLPRTGANIDRLAAAGLATTAGGAALILWSAHAEPKSAAPESPDLEPEA
jgi:hypothetical protein